MTHIILGECSKNANTLIDTCTTIIDLKDVSLMKLFIGKIKDFVKISIGITQDYYPEMMHKLYIINSGFFFKGVWAIVKPWIDPVTQKKIVIISGSGKKELLEDITESNLHSDFGG